MNVQNAASPCCGWVVGCTHGNVQKVLQIMAKVVEAPRHCRSSTPWYRASLEALFWLANHHQSSQVFVHVRIVLVALQVVPCDEILNPLLDGFEVRLQHYIIPVRKRTRKTQTCICQNTTMRDHFTAMNKSTTSLVDVKDLSWESWDKQHSTTLMWRKATSVKKKGKCLLQMQQQVTQHTISRTPIKITKTCQLQQINNLCNSRKPRNCMLAYKD